MPSERPTATASPGATAGIEPAQPASVRVRRALISVSEKAGIVAFAQGLAKLGVEIVSTGGTARELTAAGIAVRAIEDFTGFPEMMDGRVKTLHPRLYAGLLARRDSDSHLAAAREHGIEQVDLVCVNLYPFEQTVARPDVTEAEAIENIDIGGPSMVRAAAKNADFAAIVTDPADYEAVIAELSGSDGRICAQTRRRLAAKAFALTARYDAAIAAWFAATEPGAETATPPAGAEAAATGRAAPAAASPTGTTAAATAQPAASPAAAPIAATGELPPAATALPAERVLSYEKVMDLRYGENPHQRGAYYAERAAPRHLLSGVTQLHGKELSFNNLLDLSAAMELAFDFPDRPCCAIVKHNNPCGCALGATPEEAYRRAFACDPLSAFGGVIALNRPLDLPTAEAISEQFVEVLLAPGFEPDALAHMQAKKNVRLLDIGAQQAAAAAKAPAGLEAKPVLGGVLLQDRDAVTETRQHMTTMTAGRQPTEQEWRDMLFAWRICMRVRSNAIVIAASDATVGIGAGQMSRVDAVAIAVEKARQFQPDRLAGAALASDAFFPFPDGPQAGIDAGVTAIIQPGGSVKDDEVVAAADAAGVVMVATAVRHFRH